MIYEELKSKDINRFVAGIASGMLSTSLTHPFELIRARLQTKGLGLDPEVAAEKGKSTHLIW